MKTDTIYKFGDFRIDTAEQTLLCNGEAVSMTPKVFDLLVLLVENRGHLMEKKVLLEALWPDSFVEEANLNVNISALRRALGEKPNEHRYIETIPRRGYRFVAEVLEVSDGEVDEALSISGDTTISFDVRGRQCPKCGKVYYDESLNYCLDDGASLAGKPLDSDKRSAAPWAGAFRIGLLVVVLAAAGIGFAFWKYGAPSPNAEASAIRSLAVLPFKPLVKNQNDDALEIGMADALITKLGNLEQITVRPTSAVTKYDADDTDPITAGRELQVEAVLDGKIQRSDNKIRVTVQLLRVSDGATIWAGSFDDFFTNIFAVQDSISERMLSSLSLKISGKEKSLLAKRHTENTEAYQLYLQARYYHEKISEEGTKNALVYYRAALERDPEYALVYASMVGALAHLVNLNIDREANLQTARDSAAKAVGLDPNLAEAHDALATIKDVFDWNWEEAEVGFKRALELDPRNADVHFSYSLFLSRQKRHDEAIRAIKAAREYNPTAVFIQNQVTQTFIRAHRFDDAIREARKAVGMDPENLQAHTHLVRLYLYKGMPTEAENELQQFQGFSARGKERLTAEINLHTDKRAEGERALRGIAEKFGPGDSYTIFASYYVKLNDLDKAFELLEKAYERREAHLTTLSVEPDWDPVRSDPRYLDLIRRMKLPE